MFSSNDRMCLAGADTTTYDGGPGALLRGGSFFDGTIAGPLAVSGAITPSDSADVGASAAPRSCEHALRFQQGGLLAETKGRIAQRLQSRRHRTLGRPCSDGGFDARVAEAPEARDRSGTPRPVLFGGLDPLLNLGPRAGGRSNADSCRSSGRSRPSGTVSHPPPGPRPGRSAIRCDSATRQPRDRHSGAGAWRN